VKQAAKEHRLNFMIEKRVWGVDVAAPIMIRCLLLLLEKQHSIVPVPRCFYLPSFSHRERPFTTRRPIF
jgi:hypothetical protein